MKTLLSWVWGIGHDVRSLGIAINIAEILEIT